MLNTSEKDCCEPTDITKFNPLLHRPRHEVNRTFKLHEIENPIPNEIKDTDEIKKLFIDWPFIPFAGYEKVTAHCLLQKMIDFKNLSVTHGACIESKKSFAFGGRIDIVRNYSPIFDLGEEEEVSIDLKREYIEAVNKINLNGETWASIRCKFSESFDTTGNEWLEIVLTETIGVKGAGIFHHQATDCLYVATEPNEDRKVAVSCRWDDNYLRENPPRYLPLFPNFNKYPDGTIRSMVHVKNGDFKWYGRPQSYSSFIDQYNEYQNRIYLAKQSKKGFIGQVLLEYEEMEAKGLQRVDQNAKEAGFKNTADRFNKNFTNDGKDPSTAIVTSRPFGAKPMLVHQFQPNTNEKYFTEIGSLTRTNIIMSHDWSEMLLRSDGASGFSENIVDKIFDTKSATTILTRQTLVDSTINTILDTIMEWFGIDKFKGLAQVSKSPIQKMLEQKAEQSLENTNTNEVPDS